MKKNGESELPKRLKKMLPEDTMTILRECLNCRDKCLFFYLDIYFNRYM